MKCPYCVSEINSEAVVCPVCRRDLYLFTPLREKIAELEKKLQLGDPARQAQLEARVAELENQLAAREAAPPPEPEAPPKARSYVLNVLVAAVISLALLLAAHGIIVILYDLKTLDRKSTRLNSSHT